MVSGLLKSVTSVVGSVINKRQDRKILEEKNKGELQILEHKTKLAQQEARLRMAESGQTQNYNLDEIAMKNMEKSWKDEVILVIFLTPLVLSFFPQTQPLVVAGFTAIDAMPIWYRAIIIGMIVVIYGLRGLLDAYLKHNMGKLIK